MKLPKTVLGKSTPEDRLDEAIKFLNSYCIRHKTEFAKKEQDPPWWKRYKKPKTVVALEMLRAIKSGDYVKKEDVVEFQW